MKYKVGDIVWARIAGNKEWPGQIASPADASDEAVCKQLPGHFLVCLYGSRKVKLAAICALVQMLMLGLHYTGSPCGIM